LESVEQFNYFGIAVTTQNCIRKEIKSRLNSRNACYILCRICCLPGWNLWSSMLLSTNTKTNIYRTI